jgi:protein-disulfide isomerase
MTKENLKIPIAIVIAGLFIAIAVYMSNIVPQKTATTDNTQKDQTPTNFTFTQIRPVTDKDHIVGNPTADIIFVEHSDTECPYCKAFHATMNKIVDEYAKDGKVAWVYRHMPIDELHSKSRNEAASTECVASLVGEKAFWIMLNSIYEATDSNNSLTPESLPVLAVKAGAKKDDFNKCLTDKTFDAKVEADYQDGLLATNNQPGTPNSVVILKNPLTSDSLDKIKLEFAKFGIELGVSADNKMIQFGGAIPYTTIKGMIMMILNQ